MKKEIFERWYFSEGKKIAKNTFKDDVTDEKLLRSKAKEIYNSVYDYFADYHNEVLLNFEDVVSQMKFECRRLYEEYVEEFHDCEDYRKHIKEQMFDLYDSYLTKKEISKEFFERNKEHYVSQLIESTNNSKDLSTMISIIKYNMKRLDKVQLN